MSILIGAGIGLLVGIAQIAEYWKWRHLPGQSIWKALFVFPAAGAFLGTIVFLIFKV